MNVSRICMGCMGIGDPSKGMNKWAVPEEELDKNVSGQAHVADCLDRSLKRLGLDYVDLYIYHMWDYHTPMDEIIKGLNNAVKAGKTRYIGISNSCISFYFWAAVFL